jgi:hypothetical protein
VLALDFCFDARDDAFRLGEAAARHEPSRAFGQVPAHE